MINIRNLSKDELVNLTTEVLDVNEYYETLIKDKNSGVDKLRKDKKKLSELVDRIENIVVMLIDSIEEKPTPKTKCYRKNTEEEKPYKYIYNSKEGSIREL